MFVLIDVIKYIRTYIRDKICPSGRLLNKLIDFRWVIVMRITTIVVDARSFSERDQLIQAEIIGETGTGTMTVIGRDLMGMMIPVLYLRTKF